MHPARDAAVSERFRYRIDGTISASQRSGLEEILIDIATLNLNHPQLQRNRAAVLDRIRAALGAGTYSRGALERELKRWTTARDGAVPEYAGVAEYYLRRWLRRQP